MSFRLRLAQRTRRLAKPGIYGIPQIELATASQETVTFQPMGEPVIQPEPLVEFPSLFLIDAALSLPTIESDRDLLQELTQLQDTIEIIPGIETPRVAGRTYANEGEEQRLPLVGEKADGEETLSPPYPLTECRHGIAQTFCATCQNERSVVRRKMTPTFDVFAQLWFILQPPILSRIEEPDVFPGGRKPYPFQVEGVKWLLEHPQALLADQMGLGKTIQAIIAMRILFRRGEAQRVLIVCPLSVANTWGTELRNWAPELRAHKIRGTQSERAFQWQTPADVFIVTYDTLRSDTQSSDIKTGVFDLCIIDEAQNIKNPDAVRSKAVKSVTAQLRWAITGTPLENTLSDTLSIFEFILGQDYASYLGDHRFIDAAALRERIAPFTLRREFSEVELDLPDLIRQDVWLDLSSNQRTAYDRAEQDGVQAIRQQGENATRIHVFALITQLKLICNLDQPTGKSAKLEYLEGQLDELAANGEKALVFSQYPDLTLKTIMPRLESFSPLLFSGSLGGNQRNQYVRAFQDGEDTKVMLMGVKSGGTGITLTRANHVFHFDHWWTPAAEEQATHRVYRIGQERPVFVHSLYSVDTIEERILELLEDKRRLFGEVFDKVGDRDGLTRLSDQELFGLFGLEVPRAG